MQKNKISSTRGGSLGIIEKKIVRNFEIPLKISEERRNVRKHLAKDIAFTEKAKTKTCDGSTKSKISGKISTEGKKQTYSEYSRDLHTPHINSMSNLILNLNSLKFDPNIKVENLTPKSKTIVTQEVTKKLNFPYDKPIYTDLVSIELDETISTTPEYVNSTRSRKLIREKYMKSDRKRDPIPELKDFLSPVKRIEINVPLYTRPDIIKSSKSNLFEKIHEIVTNHPSYKF